MAAGLARSFRGFVGAGGILGPSLAKELRSTSRRARHYVLRFVYVSLLALFVAAAWLKWTDPGASVSPLYAASRMSEAGKQIIVGVVWFQFFAAQLAAIVLMSTSVSGEVSRRTLGVLMTTPLTGLQIVMGKLLGGTCQLLGLLAISFPVLAVVRVFGGVPWGFVVAGLCITLVACIFAAAVTMFFSILMRGTFLIVAVSAATVLGISLGMSFLMILNLFLPQMTFLSSPIVALGACTAEVFRPGSWGAGASWQWLANCAVMLALTAVVVWICSKQVRRVALRQITGDLLWTAPAWPDLPSAAGPAKPPQLPSAAAPPRPVPPKPPPPPKPAPPLRAPPGPGQICPVAGSPIVWKDLSRRRLRDQPVLIVAWALAGYVLLMMYVAAGEADGLGSKGAQRFFAVAYLLGLMVATAVLAAGTIAPEKQSGTWPLLLTTALSDWEILWAKVRCVWWKAWPIWAALSGHALVFSLFHILHPIVVVHMAMLAASVMVLLTGIGLYFSARLRRTTSAVLATMAVPIVLWLAVPAMLALTDTVAELDGHLNRSYSSLNPLVQTSVVVGGAVVKGIARPVYDWPEGRMGMGATTWLLLKSTLAFVGIGVLAAWHAKRLFRRTVF